MSSIAYTLAQKRVAAVQEVVEQWQIDHQEAQLGYDVEQIVEETASLIYPIQRVTKVFEKKTFPASYTDQLVSVHMIAFLLNEALRLFPQIDSLVGEAHHKGLSIDGLDRFEAARSELKKIDASLRGHWALPNKQTVKAARKDMSDGKFRTL